MTYAYDRNYLEAARAVLGRMLDYAVYDLKYELSDFWDRFLASPVSLLFEQGDASVVVGRSGVELALMVCGKNKNYPRPRFTEERSAEYWLGWAIAYFQWSTGIPFSQITEFVPIVKIRDMYSPYHEMDVRQFCDALSAVYAKYKKETNLKRKRKEAGISQSQFADLTGIPLRTIQQYEQGQKSINKARAEYLIAMARALCCKPELLLENEPAD